MQGFVPMRKWSALLVLFGSVAGGLSITATGFAQGYVPGGYGYNRPYYGYGGFGYGGYGAGSTPMGSYMAGMSQVIRAQGQYNLLSSEAAINLEEANRRDIENQAKWTNTYFEMRKVNEAYQKSTRAAPPTPEAAEQMAHAAAPARLTTSVLDPVTGKIAWPTALQGDAFEADRETLGRLFSERAVTHGAIGADTHAQIRAAVDQSLDKLKSRIRDLDPRTYLEARNFLTSLGHEASFPTTAG